MAGGNKDTPVQQAPDCTECIHYYITHDASFPYGCRALDFKSKRKPYLDVLEASSHPCLAYEPRCRVKRPAEDPGKEQ